MSNENKEGPSLKPVLFLIAIVIIVILLYLLFTKTNLIFKQGGSTGGTVITDNTGATITGGQTNKLLIATDTGEIRELDVGDSILIQNYLGDTISSNEIELRAVEFKHWATNGCHTGQIPKFNGLNWVCADDETTGNGNPFETTTPTPVGWTPTPTSPSPVMTGYSMEVNGSTTKTIIIGYNGTEIMSADFTDLNNYVTGVTFNTSSGDLTIARNGLGPVSVDLDGRYLTASGAANLTNKTGLISMWVNDMGYLSVDGAMTFINKTINIFNNTIIGTANTVPVFDATGRLISSTITPTELANLAGSTGNIQTQLNGKVSTTRQIITNGPLSGGGALSSNLTLSIQQADSTHDGYLTSTDWNTFNNSLDPGSLAALSEGSGISIAAGGSYNGSAARTISLGPLSSDWRTQTGLTAADLLLGDGSLTYGSAEADLLVSGNAEILGTLYANDLDASGDVNFASANSTRIRQTADISNADCTYLGELILYITQNRVYSCTATGTPGTWIDIAASAATGPDEIYLTSLSYNGSFTATGGLVGYNAADYLCDDEFDGTHMCQVSDIIAYIHKNPIGALDGENAWASEGAPGYTANSNDCNGWQSSSNTYLGAFWYLVSAGGGNGALINCAQTKPIACCK